MKRTASEGKTSKSKSSSAKRSKARILRITSPRVRFVVCVNSGGYVDLEPLKVYGVKYDPAARAKGLLRVVDSSGDDYLYPANFFKPIQAPRGLFKIVEELT